MAGGSPIPVGSALGVFLQSEYGGLYAVQVTTLTIQPNRQTLLAPGNYERMWLGIVLLGTGPLTITMQFPESVDEGLVLSGSGAAMFSDARQDLAITGYAWYGWPPTLAQDVQVIEVVRVAGV